VKTKKDRLPYEDILKLSAQKGIAADLFMFSFYCFGVRIADLLRLKHSNIKDGRLVYVMRKTGVERSVKLSPQALEILSRYKPIKGNPYLFGLMKTGLNEIEESDYISLLSARYRKQLKKACKAAKIKEVSFHTARHSVADLAKSKGKDIHTIKELLGHSKTETTEIYMRELYTEQTDKEVDDLFGANF
jgi:integrase